MNLYGNIWRSNLLIYWSALQIDLLEFTFLHWSGGFVWTKYFIWKSCVHECTTIHKLEVSHYGHLIWRKVPFYRWDPSCCKFNELKFLFFVGNSSKNLKNKWIFLIWLFWFVKSESRKCSNDGGTCMWV
jgi:hypothetical protein